MLRLHHTKLPAYMREMKKYHLAHHYKNFELGFGVTSEFALRIVMVLLLTSQAKSGITYLIPFYRSKEQFVTGIPQEGLFIHPK